MISNIPSNQAGEKFTVTGTVSAVIGGATVSKSASMECTVKSRGVKAKIRFGKTAKRFTNQRVLIDGSVSKDLDQTWVTTKMIEQGPILAIGCAEIPQREGLSAVDRETERSSKERNSTGSHEWQWESLSLSLIWRKQNACQHTEINTTLITVISLFWVEQLIQMIAIRHGRQQRNWDSVGD